MIQLGKNQTLEVVKKTEFGVYLGTEDDKILLPKKQVPENIEKGSEINVFVYRDSKDRLIATTNTPLITLSQVALLEVKEVGKIGAFLDWGLEKDLLLPFKEMTKRVSPGEKILVAMYIDKSSRLAATMKVYDYLSNNSPYIIEDEVKGVVYEIIEQFGAFVAIDNRYSGLIPKQDVHDDVKVGDFITARVTSVKEDGKLSLNIRKKAYQQLDEDGEKILSVIDEYAGVLPYNDKASPEVIKNDFNISKAAFKRAIGTLYKNHRIDLKDGKIFKL